MSESQPSTSKPRIIVISGLPGAGKSTVSRALAIRLGRTAHVEADVVQSLIVAGAEHPTGEGTSPEATRQLSLRLSNACMLARSFVAAGFSAIIDEIIHGDRFDELVDGLAGEPFTFVMLHRSYDELRATWQNMGSPFAESWEWVSEEIDYATPRVGLWLDNGELGVQATVDRIVEELRRS